MLYLISIILNERDNKRDVLIVLLRRRRNILNEYSTNNSDITNNNSINSDMYSRLYDIQRDKNKQE